VQALGTLDLWKIAMKPGKPLAFGAVAGTPFFGLPGNPVSAYVTFLLFVRPFLQRVAGEGDTAWRVWRVPAGFAWSCAGKREEYLRVQLQTDATGQLQAVAYPHQGSGVLSSVSWAHALLRVPAGTIFAEGELVDCLLL
jgi:molybdopterin molybdotransferase